MHRGTQTRQGTWRPLPVCIPERLHRYWGHTVILFLLMSVVWLQKEHLQDLCHRHQALSVWLRRICTWQWEIDFSPALGPLPQSAFHSIGKKFGYLCFTDRIISTCLSNLWSDETGLGGLQQQQALPFQYFCPNLGNFTEETMAKQCLCICARCVRESQTAKGCGHYRMFLS